MQQFAIVSLAIVLVSQPALPQDAAPVVREGRYWVRTLNGTVTSTTLERFRLNTVGSVVLRGDANGRAVYSLKARVRARDAREAEALLRQFEVKTRAQGEWVSMTVVPPKHLSEPPELTVSVPRALLQTWIETRGGNLQVAGLEGELQARSGGGKIEVDNIGGRADVRTGGGDIEVGTVGGPVRCYSGGGIIRVQSAGADAWVETAGGEIIVRHAMGQVHASTAGGNIRVDRATGAVFARTAAGLIQVQQAGGAVTAESSGGAILVNAANGVSCDSSGGAIRLKNVTGAVRASTSAGSISAELLSGNRIQDSTLSTNAGDITVFISSNLPLTVLARNESGGTLGRIISDFPEIRVKAAQASVSPVLAEGALNGGGPVLHINVIGGTIYLRRQK